MNNKSKPTDMKNHMLWDQWYDTFAITSITVLAWWCWRDVKVFSHCLIAACNRKVVLS